jgi:hypothetical protein
MADTTPCPYCGSGLSEAWYAIKDTVLFSQSKQSMVDFVASRGGKRLEQSGDPASQTEMVASEDERYHVVVGSSGWQRGRWPKEGLYCKQCGTMIVKLRPH